MYEYDWSEEFKSVPSDVLTVNQRDVVYLRYVAGLRFSEIAEEVGLSKQAVVRIHRQALLKIQEFVENVAILKVCYQSGAFDDTIDDEDCSDW